MLGKAFQRLIAAGSQKQGLSLAVSGMAALVSGQKLAALSMFGKGFADLEAAWRRAHPDFDGGVRERIEHALAFYDATHQDPTNRKLHVIGIPLIVGGAVGLLLSAPLRPLWMVSASAFAGGWALNLIGHAYYERNAPAFAADPVAFVVGPVWDLREVLAAS